MTNSPLSSDSKNVLKINYHAAGRNQNCLTDEVYEDKICTEIISCKKEITIECCIYLSADLTGKRPIAN
jgi:hypothetical protein